MGRLHLFPQHSEASSTIAYTGEGVGSLCGFLIAGSAEPYESQEALGTEELGD